MTDGFGEGIAVMILIGGGELIASIFFFGFL